MSLLSARPRRIGATAILALVAGLVAVSPSQAATTCEPRPVPINNNAGNAAPTPANDSFTVLGGTRGTFAVLANDTDPEGNTLGVANVTQPGRGEVCVNSDNTVTLFSEASQTAYSTSFTYGVTDGDRYREATVTVAVQALKPVTATLQRKLRPKAARKANRAARVTFTNPNARRLLVVAGNARKEDFERQFYVAPGATVTVPFRVRQVGYVAVLENSDSTTFVNLGIIDTRTGRRQVEYIGESFSEDSFFRTSASRQAWARVAR